MTQGNNNLIRHNFEISLHDSKKLKLKDYQQICMFLRLHSPYNIIFLIYTMDYNVAVRSGS